MTKEEIDINRISGARQFAIHFLGITDTALVDAYVNQGYVSTRRFPVKVTKQS